MTTFFTSDFHYFHNKIVEYTDRKQVISQEDHDAWLINIWNSQVKPGDTVYHLGDFSFGSRDATSIILSQLKGNKVFIKGNHDNSKDLNYFAYDGCAIESWHDYKEIKIQGITTCLFHFPLVSWNKAHYGAYHLHGHAHSGYQPALGKILDVGLDNAYKVLGEHRLFTEEEVIEYMKTRVTYSADGHQPRKGE